MSRRKGRKPRRKERHAPPSPAAEPQAISAPPPGPRSHLLWFLVVFAAAFAVRAAHVLSIRAAPFFDLKIGDAEIYDTWARTIAAGDWLGTDVFYQAPLYPYFLGTLYKFLGNDLLTARLSQAVLGSAAAVLLAWAGWRFFSFRTGLVAGLLLAFYAPAIFFDTLIQKSALDLFLLCLTLGLLGELSATPRRTLWWLLGMALGGLALTRENALILVAPILIWLVVAHRSLGKTRLLFVALFFGGMATLLGPVAVRNRVVGGEFHLTTSQLGPNLFIGNNEAGDGTYAPLKSRRGYARYEREDATRLAEAALGRELSPSEVSAYYVDRVLDFVRSRPGKWVALMWRKLVLTWNAQELVDTEDQYTCAAWSPVLRISGYVFHFGTLVPLALFGAFVTWTHRTRLWLLYLIVGTYAASVVLFYVFARYRFPLVPVLILFAAAGLVGAPAFFRSRPLAQTAPALAASLAMAIFSNWPMVDRANMRAMTHYNFGGALELQGRTVEAAEQYRQALRLRPELPQANYNLGNLLLNRGEADKAIRYFEQAVRSQPDYSEAHNNLGNLLFAKGDTARAAEHFEQAVRLDPDNEDAQYNLGNIYFSQKKVDLAAERYRAALRINPDNANAHYNLGNLYYGQRKLDEAAAQYREAIGIDPYIAKAHNNLGIIAAIQGRLDEAVKRFQDALDVEPDYEEARKNLLRAGGSTP